MNLAFLHDATTTYAIDLNTHTEVWSYPAAGHLTLSDEGALYIATRNGELIAINIDADSDGDGLTNVGEIKFYGTDPENADTDADGMQDGYELNHFLDPLVDDAGGDADSDGLSNLGELTNNTDPNINGTDGDGLLDGEEVNTYLTDPNNRDTDSDRLDDHWEISNGLDPLDVLDADLDADSDGLTNVVEFYLDSNPNDVLSVSTVSAWVTHQGNASHTGFVPKELDSTNFSERWNVSPFQGRPLNPVTAAEGKVFASESSYFGSNQSIAAVNGVNGNVLWEKGFGNIHSINPPAYDDGKIYFQTGGHEDSYLRGLDVATGSLVFQSSYANQWSRHNAPTSYDGNVYAVGYGVYSFNANNGSEQWLSDSVGYDEWTPAVDQNNVYAYTTGGNLSVFNRASGQLEYSILDPLYDWSGYSLYQAPVLGHYQNILLTNGGRLVNFDLRSKSIGWQVNGSFTGQVSLGLGQVFAINAGALNVIDEATGTHLWIWEPSGGGSISGNMVVTMDMVFLHDATTTYAVNLNTQLEVWSYPAAGHLTLSDDGSLYIATSDGELIAINIDVDSDSDGLTDVGETNFYGTDPNNIDTDADGMQDGYELNNSLDLLVDDAVSDADSDGLSNLGELTNGTDPNNNDTDADGLLDGEEVNTYLTDPNNRDSDGDRIDDSAEIINGLDPQNATDADLDADGDGFSNIAEYFLGTDYFDALSLPAVSAWATYQGNTSHTGLVPIILDPAVFNLRWNASPISGRSLHPAIVAEGKVFVSESTSYSADQSIAAIDVTDGSVLWTNGYGNISSIDPPAYADGKVYFQTGGHSDSYLRSLDATTGSLVFQSSYNNQWSRYYSPTPYAGNIYLNGGYYGGAYNFNGNTGGELWFADLTQYDQWTPAVDENYLYAYTGQVSAGGFGRLSVIDRITGQVEFTIYDTSYNWTGYSMDLAPVLGFYQNVLVINDGRLVSFDLQSESIGWQLSENFSGQVSLGLGQIFAINAGALNVIDEFTGAHLWTWEPPSGGSVTGNMIVTPNLVFLHNSTTTYAVDLNTQLEVWNYPAAGHLTLSDEGALYIATSSGELIAINIQN